MKLTYYDVKLNTELIEEIHFFSLNKEDLPFKSTILPIALPSITFIQNKHQKAIFKNEEFLLQNLILTGQFYNSYTLHTLEEGYTFGASFHPTALYKLLQIDMYQFYNKHVPLKKINSNLFETLDLIFKNSKFTDNFSEIAVLFEKAINNLSIKIDETIKLIDDAIVLIRTKEGLLNVSDILEKIPMSQKTLENQFKKIVGITPGKYIRLWRFLKLMRKYESGKIKLNDLIQMYDYYDHSHFAKDFQVFMKESPTSYFQKDNHLLHQYLKE